MGANLSDGVHVLRLDLHDSAAGNLRHSRRVVVHDLPRPIHFPPHVREPSLHGLTVPGRTGHESVQASVQVGARTEALHVVRGDGAVGELLEELHKVLLGGLRVADELGRDGGEEGEVGGGVEGGNLVKVLLLEGIVPGLEVFLPNRKRSIQRNQNR